MSGEGSFHHRAAEPQSGNETQRFAGNSHRETKRLAERLSNRETPEHVPGLPIIAVPGLVSLPLWWSGTVPESGDDVYNRQTPFGLKVEELLADLRVRLYHRDGSHYDEPCGCWLVQARRGVYVEESPLIVRRYLKPKARAWRVLPASDDLLPQVQALLKERQP